MNGFVFWIGILVVPGCSGAPDRDKTGTGTYGFEPSCPKARKNMAVTHRTWEDASTRRVKLRRPQTFVGCVHSGIRFRSCAFASTRSESRRHKH